ncbi:MAG: SPOR domain-containing protein [Balneola sp.]|nr:SPOR domain-containing protein [Balneola sp.]MBO6651852.1 SPOR domain-containing protein [Balneola sp.]MBO6710429.1 SPOR domain-containing protein [Balneola sp.]MBO6799114.1 SPOR domain-containing protein [Balneola sp.]MBO6870954.1 SPOR domain-containing protein [Balneola sp.]
MKSVTKILINILLVGTVFVACTTSNSTISDTESDNSEMSESASEESGTSDSESDLISSLSDIYSSNNNEVPNVYSRIKKEREVEVDLTKGYRIQVYSGQNVFEADTMASRFRAWSDTTITGYQAETYTFFKTPYYRVHVGDFHSRDRALSFSKLVKRFFRDAWVVYDSVNPYLVPDDTTSIRLQEL